MAGWTFVPTNRVITSTVTITTGTIVAAYPLVNLTDPMHWMYTKITSAAGVVELSFSMGTPSGTDHNVSALGLIGEFDGCSFELRHTGATWAGATSVLNKTHQSNCSHPSSLNTFSNVSSDYWHLRFSSCPTTLVIGKIILGPAFDFGDPLRAPQFVPVPYTEPLVTAGGYEIPTQLTEPIDTKIVTFHDPSKLGESVVWSKARSSSYPTYNTAWYAWRHLRSYDQGGTGTVHTGLSAAGGQVPIIYHEGDDRGLSANGRPAFYGYCRPTFSENVTRDSSEIVMTIRDAQPKQVDQAAV